MGALYITCQSWISVKLTFCCFTYLYREIRPILSFLEYPRGRDSFLPKFHLILLKFHFIPPKNFLFPTWRF